MERERETLRSGLRCNSCQYWWKSRTAVSRYGLRTNGEAGEGVAECLRIPESGILSLYYMESKHPWISRGLCACSVFAYLWRTSLLVRKKLRRLCACRLARNSGRSKGHIIIITTVAVVVSQNGNASQ